MRPTWGPPEDLNLNLILTEDAHYRVMLWRAEKFGAHGRVRDGDLLVTN